MGVWLDLLGMVLKSSPAQKALTNVAKEFISRPELVKDVVVGSTKMIISSATLINGLMVLRQTAHVTRLNKFTTRKVAEEQKGTQVEVEALNRRCQECRQSGNTAYGKLFPGGNPNSSAIQKERVVQRTNEGTYSGLRIKGDRKPYLLQKLTYEEVDPEFDNMLNRNRGQVLSLENL